jgi:hypothetical protein
MGPVTGGPRDTGHFGAHVCRWDHDCTVSSRQQYQEWTLLFDIYPLSNLPT